MYYSPYLILNFNNDLVSLILPFRPPSHGEIKLDVLDLFIFRIGYLDVILDSNLQISSVCSQMVRTQRK